MKLLLYTAHGGVELLDSEKQGARILWTSDNDQDFMEEFPDAIDPDKDEPDVLNYLIEEEYLDENEELEVDTRYLEDEENDDGD